MAFFGARVGLTEREITGACAPDPAFYHLIAFATNALKIPLEPYGARFPPG